METIFKQEWGVIYDTLNIFLMKLNEKELWVDHVIRNGIETEDTAYIDYWLNQFDEIPNTLMLFFYLKDQRAKGFLVSKLGKWIEDFGCDLSYRDIIAYFENVEKVKKDLSNFYFGKEITDINDFNVSLRERKDMDGELRFYLMDFMLNPNVYLNELRKAFLSCYEKTLDFHREKEHATIKWQESFKEETLYAFALRFYSKEVLEKNVNSTNEPVVLSMSLFRRNCIASEIEKKTKWFILGIDYRRQAKCDKELVVDMAALGNAFGDKHRLKIVRLLLRNGELSVSDLANKMGLAVNTTSYHLDIMRKANLLRSRSKGKSTVYWMNTQVCAIISETLDDWSKGGGSVEKSVEKTYGYRVNAGGDE